MAERRKLAYSSFLLLLLLALSEGLSFWIGKFFEEKHVFYRAILGNYQTYLALRDPVVGWPSPSLFGKADYDRIGSRVIPQFPDPHKHSALVSLYGDSFTWASQVESDQAWGNQLARRLGQRVNNFGVRGYGSDQAFLRFLHNDSDQAPIVILGHLSENILRNLNQLRDLLSHSGGIGFKPRFILDSEGQIQLIPLPNLSKAEYLRCSRNPGVYLRHEEFLPEQPSGPMILRFPFTWSVLRSLKHYHVRAKLRGEPRHMQFYRADHQAQGTLITAKILERFCDETRSRNRTPVVLVIPTGLDLEYIQDHQVWPYQPLVDELTTRKLPFLDAGPHLIKKIGDTPIDDYFVGDTSHHLNPAGNRLLAEIVYEYLMSRELVRRDPLRPPGFPATAMSQPDPNAEDLSIVERKFSRYKAEQYETTEHVSLNGGKIGRKADAGDSNCQDHPVLAKTEQ